MKTTVILIIAILLIPMSVTALKRAYPNPFNPETVIEFAAADVSDVTIDVFDITGRRIVSLIDNEKIEPGYHRVVWKGVDKQGRRMSSGVYFYRMVTDEYEKIRKVLMLK